MLVHARAPLRLGLAGGGTDVAAYSDIYGGRVVNATINKYAYVELSERLDGDVIFHSTDFGVSISDSVHSAFSGDSEMPLHTAVYSKIMAEFNGGKKLAVEMTTFSDAPVGSGLGASSTLVVAMIKAYDCLLGLGLSQYKIAELAYEIERMDCGLAGGRQDQYSASFGGFNFMEFQENKVSVTSLMLAKEFLAELESSMLLFYSGVSRASAEIIDDQTKTIQSETNTALVAMHAIKSEAIAMRSHLEQGDSGGIIDSMKSGWASKKATSRFVTNPNLDRIYDAAISAGALAGKVSGAGGGGFMWFYCPIGKRAAIQDALANFNGTVSNCHFSFEGAQAWRIN